MRTKFSFESFLQSLQKCVNRFPLTILFSVALFVACVYMVLDENYRGVIIYYLASGYLLSLMLELWGEESSDKKRFIIYAAVGHLLLAIDAVYLWNLDVKNYDTALYISRGAVEIAMLLGIFYLSFLKQKEDVQSWNFVRHLCISALLCQLVGGVMTGGFSGLLFGIESLFGLDFSYKVYEVDSLLWAQLLPQLLFLSRIPAGEEKHDDTILRSGFLLGVTRYLFVPLVACYMWVLYGYLFKILITWSLPKGAVTYCVCAMMFGIIVIQFLLYPTLRSGEARRYERMASRWMPVLALPLVALMTIGLIRRFSDYGITTERLYAMTLNVWFYVVCLVMWFTQSRRIHWISLSFGALLLLTSAHPFNYTELTRYSLMNSLSKVIDSNPPSHLPMSASEFARWIDSLPEEQQASTYSKFQYLDEWTNRRKSLDAWLEKDVYLYRRYESYHNYTYVEEESELYFPWNADTLVYYHTPIQEVLIPSGAHQMVKRHQTLKLKECPADSLITFNVVYETSQIRDSVDIVLSIPELRKMQRDSLSPKNYLDVEGDSFPIVQPSKVDIREYRGAIKVECETAVFLP